MPSSSVTDTQASGPVVRKATAADLPRIVELLAQLSMDGPREQPGPPLPERYREVFREIDSDPRQQLLVLEAEGRVAGSLSLIIVPNLTRVARPCAIIENVVMDASERGAGYGEMLMRHAIEEARRAGCYKASLTSNKGRPDAHRFYERLGFQATHEGYRVEF